MKITVIRFNIANEMDIVLAHKRAGQLCDLTGLSFYNKTSFITAVSEICRNTMEHAVSGKISFNVYHDGSRFEAVITDKGPGIENVNHYLNKPYNPDVKGCGLQNAKKLVDVFTIKTSENGTTVELIMKTSRRSVPVTKAIINEWVKFFKNEKPSTPYEEIKRQNDQLLELSEQLHIKNLETSAQLEQIKQLNSQLNKSNQELEDFASTLSHDLRSPVANLKMLISLINNPNTSDKSEYIAKFKGQVERLDNMILSLTEIIDLRNTQNVVPATVYFEDILNVVKDELRREIESTGCTIYIDFSGHKSISFYEVYLHSIVLNLVSNAIKYRTDTKPPVVKISTSGEGAYTVLSVEDNGIGMDMEAIGDNLFKPFKRFHTDREGKGIGLHIIKGMVEKNGGYIQVQSKPGKGSRFKVFLVEYKN